jgi:hypothetical protein
MSKLEEYYARWVDLRDEMWKIKARLEQIKKELPLIEAWMTALEREPKTKPEEVKP